MTGGVGFVGFADPWQLDSGVYIFETAQKLHLSAVEVEVSAFLKNI